MFKSTTAILLIAGMATVSADFLQGRELQSITVKTNTTTNSTATTTNTTVKANTTATTTNTSVVVPSTPAIRGLRFYGDAPKINYVANLGCGGCIRGGYAFCVPTNVSAADPLTYPTGKKATCCKDDTCVASLYKDTTAKWTCSTRNYTDSTLALNMCPFDKKKCGSNNGTLSFSNAGDSQSISISLAVGETCTFRVEAKCGLPSFQPLTNVTGFDIQMVDYDDDDFDATQSVIKAQ